jgi:ATP-dependent DNA ligase
MIRSGERATTLAHGEVALRPPVPPMLAAPADTLPTGPGWVYEPKWDGWRALAFCEPGRVYLQSRTGKALLAYFPDVARVIADTVPVGAVLDGELLVWDPDRERTSFALLQRRIGAGGVLRLAARYPAQYVAFDLLHDGEGQDLTGLPLAERRAHLTDLLAGAPARLILCPQTTELTLAQDWMTAGATVGIEGVVAKRLDAPYQPGRRGWRKVKSRRTVEAIIGGVTGTLDQPHTLLIGRFDANGRLRYAGRTHPLTPHQRPDIARALRPAGRQRRGAVDHPWPQPLPPAWTGQLGPTQPLRYLQVQPTAVVEIEVDTAYEHQRWRHLVRYLRLRPDLSVYDVSLHLP